MGALVPGLKARVEQLSKYPGMVLSKILMAPAQTMSLSLEEAILVGGDPYFIQGPHDPKCAVCRQPMRFLFQFGDMTQNFQLGDCGIGYVYGCDTHPNRCEGFVDCY
jgi:hypothetical protein